MKALQIEYLRELMNISMGAATSSLAEILDAFGTMHIPEVFLSDISHFHNLLETYAHKEHYYLTHQLFHGKFSGETLFLLNESSAENLFKHLYKQAHNTAEEKIDAMLELANILNATIIGKLAQELDILVQFSVPTSSALLHEDFLKAEDLLKYQKIIVIKTIMHFEALSIEGEILILTKDEAIDQLTALIDTKLEELFL